MKVLMYGWEFPPRISGGLGVACHAIVKELARLGESLTLVLPHALDIPDVHPNVKIVGCDVVAESLKHALASSDEIFSDVAQLLLTPYSSAWINKQSSSISLVEQEARLLRFINNDLRLTGDYGQDLMQEVYRFAELAGSMALEVEHDVIHAHDWLTVLAGVKAKKISGKPLFVHAHALEVDRSGTGRINNAVYEIEKYGFLNADMIMAVSQHTKKNIVRYYGIDPDKIAVVYNGIYINSDEIDNIPRDQRLKTVLFLGRVTYQKGPKFFIEMAARIIKQGRDDVHFVMAGSGDQFKEMIHKVAELGIGRNFHFTGFLNRGMVNKVLGMADVYVMPSVSEPFGLSCLEALVANVPAVISKQSGVGEVLHNVFSVDFWDIDLMAEKVLSLIDSSNLSVGMVRRSKPEVARLSWRKTAQEVVKNYELCNKI